MHSPFRDSGLTLKSAFFFLGLFLLSVVVWAVLPNEASGEGLPLWAIVIVGVQLVAMGVVALLAKWSAEAERD